MASDQERHERHVELKAQLVGAADETPACRAQYPPSHPTARIIRCHLPASHPGEHEEADTEVTWTSDAARPAAVADQAGEDRNGKSLRLTAVENRVANWFTPSIAIGDITMTASTQRVIGDDLRYLLAELAEATRERDEALTDGRRMWAELREARANRVQAVLALVVGYTWRDPATGAELVLAPEDVRLIVRDDGSGTDA
jgi:hypothetical protein